MWRHSHAGTKSGHRVAFTFGISEQVGPPKPTSLLSAIHRRSSDIICRASSRLSVCLRPSSSAASRTCRTEGWRGAKACWVTSAQPERPLIYLGHLLTGSAYFPFQLALSFSQSGLTCFTDCRLFHFLLHLSLSNRP